MARSLKLFATVRREDLEDPTVFDRLFTRTRRIQERAERAMAVGKLRTKGDLLGARDALDAVIHLEETLWADGVEDRTDGKAPTQFKRAEHRADVVRDLARMGGRSAQRTTT